MYLKLFDNNIVLILEISFSGRGRVLVKQLREKPDKVERIKYLMEGFNVST